MSIGQKAYKLHRLYERKAQLSAKLREAQTAIDDLTSELGVVLMPADRVEARGMVFEWVIKLRKAVGYSRVVDYMLKWLPSDSAEALELQRRIVAETTVRENPKIEVVSGEARKAA